MKKEKPDKDKNSTTISIRTTKIRKEEVRSILAVLNDKREPNERKKTDKYLEEFFIESYKQNPEFFSVKVELIEEKKELRRINRELEKLEFLKVKSEEKINKLQSILANDSLDNYSSDNSSNGVILDSTVKKALNHLIKLMNTKNIYTMEELNRNLNLVEQLVTASLNVVEGKVTKRTLVLALKQELKNNPDLIIDAVEFEIE